MVILGVIIAIYVFARKAVINEPFKGQIDLALANVNNYLSTIKSVKPSFILNSLSKLAMKIVIYSLFLFILILTVFPKNIALKISTLVSVVFVFSMLLNFSVDWNQKHKKSVKELFFNIQSIILILAPTLICLFDFLVGTNYYDFFFKDLFSIIKTESILVVQLIWLLFFSIFIYLGFWIVAIPIYFTLYVLILLFTLTIRLIEKYIDIHILDAIIAILTLFCVFLKALY